MDALISPGDDADPTTDDGLWAWYAPPQRAWVRANFVTSVDGAAAVGDTSGGLSSPGDKRVFATLRAQADVILVGSGTVRAEDYGGVRHDAAAMARRAAHGLAAVARLAVVSGRAAFRGDERWITEATATPLLLTTDAAAHAIAGVEVVGCGASVTPATALAALESRGLSGVLCEGGPSLFAELGGSGRLDELCLTTAGLLGGPGSGRIVAGDAWGAPRRLRLHALAGEADTLFARWLATR